MGIAGTNVASGAGVAGIGVIGVIGITGITGTGVAIGTVGAGLTGAGATIRGVTIGGHSVFVAGVGVDSVVAVGVGVDSVVAVGVGVDLAFAVSFTVTLQEYFFFPIFACTFAVPLFLPTTVTSDFFLLFREMFVLPEATFQVTFFLLFFSFNFLDCPTLTVSCWVLSDTLFAAPALV